MLDLLFRLGISASASELSIPLLTCRFRCALCCSAAWFHLPLCIFRVNVVFFRSSGCSRYYYYDDDDDDDDDYYYDYDDDDYYYDHD